MDNALDIVIYTRHRRRRLYRSTLIAYVTPNRSYGFKWEPDMGLPIEVRRGKLYDQMYKVDPALKEARYLIEPIDELPRLLGYSISGSHSDWVVLLLRGHLNSHQVQKIHDRVIPAMKSFFGAKDVNIRDMADLPAWEQRSLQYYSP